MVKFNFHCVFKPSKLVTLFIIALLPFYFFSCIPKPIDIKIDAPKPKLVVSSQVIPGFTMIVALTKSFSALSQTAHSNTSNNYIDSIVTKNAFITINHSGVTDTLFMLMPGVYASTDTLIDNYGVYNLYAKDWASGLEVRATTTLLPPVKFDTIIPSVEKGNDTLVGVKYTFTDIPGIENYYVVSYFVKQASKSGTIDVNNYFNRGSNQLSGLDIFSDKTFGDGTAFTFSRTFSGIKATDTAAVVISNISKGYYEFLSAYQRAGGWFNQLSGEPINYPTNIEGGYGYFNAYYSDYRIVYLKDY